MKFKRLLLFFWFFLVFSGQPHCVKSHSRTQSGRITDVSIRVDDAQHSFTGEESAGFHPRLQTSLSDLLSQNRLLALCNMGQTLLVKLGMYWFWHSLAGPKAGDYTYREGLEHKCKRDILLGRRRNSDNKTWKRIRPRPTKTSFVGSYYLCKGELKEVKDAGR